MVNVSDEFLAFYIFRMRTMTESTWKIQQKGLTVASIARDVV